MHQLHANLSLVSGHRHYNVMSGIRRMVEHIA